MWIIEVLSVDVYIRFTIYFFVECYLEIVYNVEVRFILNVDRMCRYFYEISN